MKRTALALILLLATSLSTLAAPVKASSFGFNDTDATQCLQKAIDSGAKQLIVDNLGKPWILNEITLRSNQEIIFADGVRVKALKGAFKRQGDTLFYARNCDNVIFRGEGNAVLEMNKKDYQDVSQYKWSEWRHLLSMVGCNNVTVKNLTLKSSGGDGIYVGANSKQNYSQNVLIEDVISLDHHRQAISVISVKGLTIRNCKFNATSGTPPTAGVDFEPNFRGQYLENILIENSEFNGNFGSGIMIYNGFTSEDVPLSFTIRNCTMNNNRTGFSVTLNADKDPVKGFITLENCTIKNNSLGTVYLGGCQENGPKVTLKNCHIDATNSGYCINLNSLGRENFGNVHFQGNTIIPGNNQPLTFHSASGAGLGTITGPIALTGKDGSKTTFNLSRFIKSNPPNEALKSFLVNKLVTKGTRPISRQARNGAPNSQFRGKVRFIQFVKGNHPVDMKFKVAQLGKWALKTDLTVYDADGHARKRASFKDPAFTYRLESPNDAVFTVELNSHNHLLTLDYAAPGQAIAADERVPLFGGVHRFYFLVPAGTKDMAVEIKPSSGEPAAAQLLDPKGNIVQKHPTTESTILLKHSRKNDSKTEIWSFKIPYAREDFSFRLGAPLRPYVATAPENLLK